VSHPASRNRAILLVGPTGSGKTPLGDLIERRGLWQARCLHFDFGATLRKIVQRDRPDEWLGRKQIDFLKDVLQTGALLENERFLVAERLLRRFLAGRDADPPTVLVLNGLPRHAGQAHDVDAILDVQAVISLRCSAETVAERIRGNVGGDRTGRADDDPRSIAQKLALFDARTAPLLDHYRARHAQVRVLVVTATMTADEMWQALEGQGP